MKIGPILAGLGGGLGGMALASGNSNALLGLSPMLAMLLHKHQGGGGATPSPAPTPNPADPSPTMNSGAVQANPVMPGYQLPPQFANVAKGLPANGIAPQGNPNRKRLGMALMQFGQSMGGSPFGYRPY